MIFFSFYWFSTGKTLKIKETMFVMRVTKIKIIGSCSSKKKEFKKIGNMGITQFMILTKIAHELYLSPNIKKN